MVAKRRNILFQLILLFLTTHRVSAQFNFCRLLRGVCLNSCPRRTHITLFTASILCNSRGYCCIPRQRQPAARTTTPRPIRTQRPQQSVFRDCGMPGPNNRIIGGRSAGRCEFPWSVHIHRDSSPCGGSLIDNRHIITAGHCLSNVAKSQLTITVGEHDTRYFRPRDEFIVTNYRIFLPPSYRAQYYQNDIAIIKLEEPIRWTYENCLAPICLPESWRRFYNISCIVTGWGVTQTNYSYRNPPLASVLQKVDIDVVDETICREKFGTRFFTNKNYCAGALEGGRDSCGGDSGGPLMCRGRDNRGFTKTYLAGLVSTGSNCAEPGTPAIYTDVAKFRRWIDDVVSTP